MEKTTLEIDMKTLNYKSLVRSGRITAAVALFVSSLLVAVAPVELAEEKGDPVKMYARIFTTHYSTTEIYIFRSVK